MAPLNVILFGKFQVSCGEHVLLGFDAHKVQELFCYLLLYRRRTHPRETLASHLWGDNSTAQSRKYLRQALWHLQSALNIAPYESNPVLIADAEWIQINAAANISLDVESFEHAFALAQSVPGRRLDGTQVEALHAAVQLYRDDLLVGWYQDWCLYERERLQAMYLTVLHKLMSYCEAHRDYTSGLQYGERVLSYDRAHERTHRHLMRMLYLQGDRTGALRQYERCISALKEELDVKPTERTQALYQRIRAELPPSEKMVSDQAAPLPAHDSGGPLLPQLLERLKRMHALLDLLQQEVEHEIQSVEHGLNHLKR